MRDASQCHGIRGARGAAVAAALAVLLAVAPGALASSPTTFEECDERVRDRPTDSDSYRCYWFVARNQSMLREAVRHMDQRLAARPDDAWMRLYLAAILTDLGEPRAEEEYRRALARFQETDGARGEIWARISLARFLIYQGRVQEAGDQMESALERAREADPEREGDVLVNYAWQRYHEGRYGHARTMFRQAEALLFPDGPSYLRLETLDGLGSVAWALGRPAETMRYYRRMLVEMQGGDLYREAGVRRNLAMAAEALERDGRMASAEVAELCREALDATLRGGNPLAEAGVRLMLASRLPGAEGIAEAERGLAVAERTRRLSDLVWARMLLAEKTFRVHPDRVGEAFAHAEEAVRLAREFGDPEGHARACLVRALLRWRTGPAERAETESLEAMDAVERIRDLQSDAETRARVFSRFAEEYRALADRWLAEAALPEGERIERAVRVLERMRARSLLETLDAAGAVAALRPDDPLIDERDGVLAEIAASIERLKQTEIPDEARNRTLAALDRLEARDATLRTEIAQRHTGYAALSGSALPSLEDVRAELARDQAVLSFLVQSPAGRNAGKDLSLRDWVVVVQRSGVRAVRLPDLTGIDGRITLFHALLARRDGTARPGARSLGRDVLGPALEALSDDVTRLIVVPDGPLHGIPFGALVDPGVGRRLAETHEITVVPSLATWMRWRAVREDGARLPLLALADPSPTGSRAALERAGAAPADALDPAGMPAALPWARVEVARMARRLGSRSKILQGPEATEAALRAARPSQYRVLHFAAHALAHDERPEESTILLASSAPQDDGRLDFAEIVDLDLDGPLVVLSACRGASGPVVGGEGVLGLANAFFQAGARTVVAGLWPVRDRETAALIDSFGERLARGDRVSEALAGARRERIRDGAPTAAWAGMIVLGDGDFAPLPEGGGGGVGTAVAFWVALGAIAVGSAVAATAHLRARRRTRRRGLGMR